MSSRFTRPPQRGPIAPIHRGPQALPPGTSAQPGGYYNAHAPNAALLIDFDNVTMGIQKDMQSELRNLLSSDIIKGKVSVQRAYADWRRYPGYIVPLTEASIDLIFAPAYGSAKKNATDIRLAIDAMELVFTRPEIGTFILLSGDSDFSSLVIKLKEYGKYVIGVGIRESSSDLLVQNCDEYYSYNALAGLVKSGDEETVRWDPWELVVEAVGRMVKNGDVMRADRLKQVMQDVDPGFDEKDLGMSKFSRFVHEAEKRGLLTLTRQDNGQYEIGQTRAPASAAPAAAPRGEDAAERAERAERDRGRRRGRGRGRGRDFERGPRDEAEAPEGDEGGELPVELPIERPVEREPQLTLQTFTIGTAGERLTRAEAFDLVRRAVESLTRDEGDSTSAREARVRAFELLGRDSESLNERMWVRILQDAHDANLVDLRRRGDDYELSRAAESDSVADQLNRAAAAAQAADGAPAIPAAPRGMGPRGGGPAPRGGRGPAGRAAPPPELLSIGVVGPAGGAAASAAPAAPSAPAPRVEERPVEAAPVREPAPALTTPAASAAPAAPGAPATPGGAAVGGAVTPGARRGRGPAGRGAPPPELLSVGVVAAVLPPAPMPAAPAPEAATPEPAAAPAAPAATAAPAEPTAEPQEEGETPVRGGRGRGRGGRGRGGRGTEAAPAAEAPTPEPAAAPAAAAPEAESPAPGRGRGGRGAAKTPAKTAAKAPAKAAAKGGARAAAKSAPAAAPAAPAAPAAKTARGGGRKSAGKRAT